MTVEKRLVPNRDGSSCIPEILKVLWDDGKGGWHDIHDVVSAVGPTIPPGKAYRTAERQRLNCRNARNELAAKPKRQQGTRDLATQVGKRSIITMALRQIRNSGWIEIEYDDITKKRKAYKRVRIAPGIEPIWPHEFVDGGERAAWTDKAGKVHSRALCGTCGRPRRWNRSGERDDKFHLS